MYPALQSAHKVILFGPTFRGPEAEVYFPMHHMDLARLAQFCRRRQAVVLFKLHFAIPRRSLGLEPYSDVLIDVSDHREINDLMLVSDLLITDYSSAVYDYSLLNKPMLFYAFDLDEYIRSQGGFYENYEEFVPGKIVKTFDALLEAIEREDFEAHKVLPFRNRSFDHLDGKSSDRVIDLFDGSL